MSKTTNKYFPEVRDRAVRMVNRAACRAFEQAPTQSSRSLRATLDARRAAS